MGWKLGLQDGCIIGCTDGLEEGPLLGCVDGVFVGDKDGL